MNTEKLMNAIGGISDRHIAEFAEIKPVASVKNAWIKFAAAAACVCFAVIGTIFFIKNSDAPQGGRPIIDIPKESETNAPQVSEPNIDISQGNETNAPQPGKIIWGNNGGDQIWKDYTEQSVKGSIILADELKIMMEKSDNPADKFAVWVTDTTEASDEEIYNTFVKPLGVDEEYMEKGIIYVTKEQINSLVCPPELALVLRLGTVPYEEVWIDEAYLETAGNERIKVIVFLEFNDEAVLAKYKEQLEALDDEEQQRRLRISIIEDEINQIIDSLISDYEIPCETLRKGIILAKFTAELEPELIARLLKDERVSSILLEQDIPGFDM